MRANVHAPIFVMLLVMISVSLICSASNKIEISGAVADLGMSQFTWDHSNFAGFFYDINKNIGTETLTFSLSGTDSENSSSALSDVENAYGNRGVLYQTAAQVVNFKYKPWGQYYVIGFLGDRDFAAYNRQITSTMSEANITVPVLHNKSVNRNLMANEQISTVLIDDDSEKAISSDNPLILKEGYQLFLKGIDTDSKGVLLELRKNNQTINTNIVRLSKDSATTSDQTYYFKTDLGATKDIIIIAVHLKDAIKTDSKANAIIDGIFQVSDNPISIKVDQQFDKLSIRTVDPNRMTITMDNKDHQIVLAKNMDISLMENFHIKTADQSTISADRPLRYYVYREAICHCQESIPS